jgi:hypothetical protein
MLHRASWVLCQVEIAARVEELVVPAAQGGLQAGAPEPEPAGLQVAHLAQAQAARLVVPRVEELAERVEQAELPEPEPAPAVLQVGRLAQARAARLAVPPVEELAVRAAREGVNTLPNLTDSQL